MEQHKIQNIEIKSTKTDTVLKYALYISLTKETYKAYEFSLLKEELKRKCKYADNSDLFHLYSSIYDTNQHNLYVLIDEWGEINLYKFSISDSIRFIEKQLLFSYRIRRMDIDFLCSNCETIKQINEEIYMFINIPYSEIKLIKFSTANQHKVSYIEQTISTEFKLTNSGIDTIATIPSSREDLIRERLKTIMQLSPLHSRTFEYQFLLEDQLAITTFKEYGNVYGKRYFFIKADEKKYLVQYSNLTWIISEYKTVEIDPNKLINVN